jgi:glycine/D-amino acid oxidase-like deaminating enzyme
MVTAKGDVFKLKCEHIPQNRIWKKGLYLVPQGDSIFKAGSTYRWGKTNPEPDEDGKIELKEKLDALLNCEYEILEHLSGIRPASKDRYPFLGEHPFTKNMFVFNGLGTKGIMLAPYMTEQLIALMENQIEIEKIISVKRFEKYIENETTNFLKMV